MEATAGSYFKRYILTISTCALSGPLLGYLVYRVVDWYYYTLPNVAPPEDPDFPSASLFVWSGFGLGLTLGICLTLRQLRKQRSLEGLRLILIMALVGPAVAYLAYLPVKKFYGKYTSQSIVLVEGQGGPQHTQLSDDLQAGIRKVTAHATSDSEMRPVLTNVFPGKSTQEIDGILDDMRHQPSLVEFPSEFHPANSDPLRLPAFVVSYQGSDPAETQKICEELTSKIVNQATDGSRMSEIRRADLPDAPDFPNLSMFLIGGLSAGLVLGIYFVSFSRAVQQFGWRRKLRLLRKRLPVNDATLKAFFDYIDTHLSSSKCDGTLRRAGEFIHKNGLSEEVILPQFKKGWGNCDCKARVWIGMLTKDFPILDEGVKAPLNMLTDHMLLTGDMKIVSAFMKDAKYAIKPPA